MLITVQAGRGLAALAVAAFHLSILLGSPRYLNHAVLENFTGLGYLGVTYFFVLSGFIMMHAHARDIGRPEQCSRYFLKRFIRLYPVYWLCVGGFCFLLSLGLGSEAKLPEGIAQWLSTFSLIRLTHFATPIGPAWTLFHEVAFYAIFALLILNRRLGICSLALWGVLSLLSFEYDTSGKHTPFLTYFSTDNLDFLIGIGAFKLATSQNGKLAGSGFLLGLVIVVTNFWLGAIGHDFFLTSLLYALGFGLVLAGAVFWEDKRTKPLFLPGAALLGNASYSIYLTHIPFEGLFAKILMKVDPELQLGPHAFYFLVYILTVSAGCSFYYLIERPMLDILRQRFTHKKKIAHA